MRSILLLALMGLLSCARGQNASAKQVHEDLSIVFPDFHATPAVIVGEHDKTYSLDGVVLRALMVAANDLIPPGTEDRPCWETLEAHGFQVIRQGDIVFVSIHADLARCGHPFLMMDSGVKYAISADGRVLRRAFDGESGAPRMATHPDAGVGKIFREPGLSTVLRPLGYDAGQQLPSGLRDGGMDADGGEPAAGDAGRSQVLSSTPFW
jgi:hypothetical protein